MLQDVRLLITRRKSFPSSDCVRSVHTNTSQGWAIWLTSMLPRVPVCPSEKQSIVDSYSLSIILIGFKVRIHQNREHDGRNKSRTLVSSTRASLFSLCAC